MIESWLVRRLLMGLTAKNYNQQLPVIVGRVAADPARADEIIYDELRTGIGEVSRWPDEDELRTHLGARGCMATSPKRGWRWSSPQWRSRSTRAR